MSLSVDHLPLENLLKDISRALDAGLYYPALVVALTVPDICVALKFDKNVFVKENHYAGFVDAYTTELGVDGQTCYRLRCGMIHRGNVAAHPYLGSPHVIFTLPGSKLRLHALSIESEGREACCLDLQIFCRSMAYAAWRWFDDNKDDPVVIENMPNLLSLRSLGFPPFDIEEPVIAS